MSDTRETIQWLKAIKDKYIHGGDDYYDEIRRQAIDEAILALDMIANGVTVQEWIPVTEGLPEDDEVVLIACKIGKMFVGYHKHLYPGCEVWRILTARDSTKKITYTITHWMPLPEPPKGE